MVLVVAATTSSDRFGGRWGPALAGYAVELVVFVLAVAVSLPPPLARAAGIATLGVGLAGGYVAGRLSADLKATSRNGVLVGAAGDFTTAVVVRVTTSLALLRAQPLSLAAPRGAP